MNGFANRGLDEDAFGEKTGNIVQAFDYFRKYFATVTRQLAYRHAHKIGNLQLLTVQTL